MSAVMSGHGQPVAVPTSFRPDVLALDPVRLIGMLCHACTAVTFPRRDSCPACGSLEELEDRALTSRGELCSWSVVRNAPAGLRTPYVLAYVDLPEDGVRLMSRLIETEDVDLVVGLPLELAAMDVAATWSEDHDPAETSDLMFAFRPRTEEQR